MAFTGKMVANVQEDTERQQEALIRHLIERKKQTQGKIGELEGQIRQIIDKIEFYKREQREKEELKNSVIVKSKKIQALKEELNLARRAREDV